MARVESGIAFATHDGVTLKGDLYAPAAGRGHPLVVAVPGGAWLRGDKADLAHWGERLADAGIAMFAIGYRRSTDGKIFPQNARDVLAGVRFAVSEATALGADSGRIGLLGASAGAHLAALALLATNDRPAVRALVGVYGVYDLAAHWRACQAATATAKDDMADRMMGSPLTGADAAYRDASPVSHLANVDSRLKALIVWGDADTTVLPVQSEAFAAGLRKAGAAVETIAVPGAGHFWFSKEKDTQSGPNGAIAPRLIRFLQDALVQAA